MDSLDSVWGGGRVGTSGVGVSGDGRRADTLRLLLHANWHLRLEDVGPDGAVSHVTGNKRRKNMKNRQMTVK